MSRPLPKSWREGHVPKVDSDAEHAVLIAEERAEERAEDALRGNPDRCSCYSVEYMEYGPVPCDWCRARDLAAIDLDGHDDKRETPEVA